MSIAAHWTQHTTPTLYIDCAHPMDASDAQALPHLLEGAVIEASHPIRLILDLTHSTTIPQDLVMNLQSGLSNIAAQVERLVVVGATNTFEVLLNTLNQMFNILGEQLLFAATCDEADVLLTQFVPNVAPGVAH